MWEIVDKYDNPLSSYLLPIIKPMNGDERTQYQNAMYLINRKLKTIGKMVGVQLPLTMYTADNLGQAWRRIRMYQYR